MIWPNYYLSPEDCKGWKKSIVEWCQTCLYVVVCYLSFTMTFVEPYQIPSGSMEPTLKGHPNLFIGDRVVALKWISKFWPFERGDVVIFVSAEDHKTFIVKRLVGLPGDKIEIKPPKVFINGKPLTESPFDRMNYVDSRISPAFTICSVDSAKIIEISRHIKADLRRQGGESKLKRITNAGFQKFSGKYYILDIQGVAGKKMINYQVLVCKQGKKSFQLLMPQLQVPVFEGMMPISLKSQEVLELTREFAENNPKLGQNFTIRNAMAKTIIGNHYCLIAEMKNGNEYYKLRFILYESAQGKISYLDTEKVPSLYGVDQPFIVPQDSYFVMGDNSYNSNDSRYWGHLPFRKVLGKAMLVFWPLPHAKILNPGNKTRRKEEK